MFVNVEQPYELTNDATPKFLPGAISVDRYGRLFKYVKALEALSVGVPCEYATGTTPASTQVYKAANGTATGRCGAGMALLTVTINYYCWLQLTGAPLVAMVTDGNVAKGDFLKGGTAVFVRDTSTLSLDVGYAQADDTSTSLSDALLFFPH